jgi:hypothetical protein
MYEKEIANGIKWLDENHERWEDKINLDTLDLFDCSLCIIGQLFKDYNHLYKIHDDDENEGFEFSKDHGFTPHKEVGQLTKEWKSAILQRRKENEEKCIMDDNELEQIPYNEEIQEKELVGV